MKHPAPAILGMSGMDSARMDTEIREKSGLDLRYPIGKFQWNGSLSERELADCLDAIEAAPRHLHQAVSGLSLEQLDSAYRPGGWTVRQVVHHLPDSHMNSFSRFKFALTEEKPVIKPYKEALWAELPDVRDTPIETSLALLDHLHVRLMVLLRSLDAAARARTFIHPEIGEVSLEKNIALYAWHGKHHVAHITGLRERMGW